MTFTRTLASYLRPHALALVGAAGCIAAGALATMGLVPLARYAAQTFAHPSVAQLNQVVAGLVGLYTLKGLCAFGQNALAQRVATAATARMREDAYAHLLDLDLRALARHRAADLSSRLVQDLGVVREAIAAAIGEVVPSLAILSYSLGYALWLNWRLAAATLVGAPIVGWAIAAFGRRLHHQSVQVQGRVSDVFVRAAETLAALPVVRSFGHGGRALARFEVDNRRHRDATYRAAAIQALQPAVLALLQTGAIGMVLWMGGYEILQGRLSGPDLFAFAAAIGVGVDPTLALGQAWGRLQAAGGALARVQELLVLPRRPRSPNPIALQDVQGMIAVRGLRFAYEPGREVLRGIDLDARPGEVVALAGPSGGGKSTLAALLLGLYEPDAGSVTLDGHGLSAIADPDLRRAVAYVPQDPTLLAGTVAENVALGKPDATREEIEAACRAANVHEVIMALPDGYRSQIGERGGMLSGGQRQRLAIARALLVDPRVLVLDEATAALDNESAALVQGALARLMLGRTTIVIAHRLEAIAHADRVYVLEAGRVSESGSPQTLLASPGVLRRLADAMAAGSPAKEN